MNKNKLGIVWVGIALVSVIVGIWTYSHGEKHNKPVTHNSLVSHSKTSPVQTAVALSTTTPPSKPSPDATSTPVFKFTQAYGVKKSTTISSSLNYGEAVAKYANSRIQFDSDCQAIPSQDAMANSVTVMLDNRSNVTQKIIIGGQKYNVAAYNYVLVTLSKKILPAYLYVNCNNRVNTGEIILE